MSDRQDAVALLNDLLRAESGSFAYRLNEAEPFAGFSSAPRLAAIRRVAAETAEHVAWLSETIVKLHGVPAPRSADASTCDAHYVSVDALIPRLIHCCEERLSLGRSASGRVTEVPAAANVVSQIQSRRKEHLRALKALQPAPTNGS